jgi:hypothetical protein
VRPSNAPDIECALLSNKKWLCMANDDMLQQ